MDELAQVLHQELRRLIDTSNLAIGIYDASRQEMNFPLVIYRGQPLDDVSAKLSGGDNPLDVVVRTGKPLLLEDWQTAPLWGDAPPRAWLAAPLLAREEVLGVIVVQSEQPGAFRSQHQAALVAVANQASLALRNIQFHQEGQRRIGQLAVLEEVGRELSSTLDLDEVLTKIMHRINAVLEVEAGSLLLVDEKTDDLVFQIALGEKAEGVKPFRLKKGEGLAGQVALTGEPLMIADVQKDRRHFKQTDVTTGFLTRSMLCVPMISRGRVIGVIQVLNKIQGDFLEEDLELLGSIANYAAIALENAILLRNVQAERDRVIAVQEEVSRKLARDLHDGPTQLVAGILGSIDFVKQAIKHNELDLAEKELAEMNELGQRASHQMRTLLFELRPLVLETEGLVPALNVLLERHQRDEAAKLHLEVVTDRPDGQITPLPARISAALFAIAQEAVNNALKHAEADNIRVRLFEREGSLAMIVEDDGVGFDMASVMSGYEQRGSLGMVNLQERAEQIGGKFVMKSLPQQGTKVTVWLPQLSAG
ncbi:MAG: GAF domain-containing protein [Anaerolineae bacterium]